MTLLHFLLAKPVVVGVSAAPACRFWAEFEVGSYR